METNLRGLFQIMTRRLGLLNKNCCSTGGIDISLVQSHILYEIDRQNQPSMQQVADALGIDITTFSRQIQTLGKLNLVKKASSPEDGRVYLLSLTPEGEFIAETIDQQMNNYLNEVFNQMNEFERDTVVRSIQLLNSCMSKSNLCCKPLG